MNGLAETLRALRKHRGLSQLDLARRAGCHENTIARLERWPERASVELLATVCEALDADAWKVFKRVQKPQRVVGSADVL